MFKWLEQLILEILQWCQPPILVKIHPRIPSEPIVNEPTIKPTPKIPKSVPKLDLTTIKGVAESLRFYDMKHNINEKWTAKNIEQWILENIEYKFSWHPRGSEEVWKTKIGDCTGNAQLAKRMLGYLDIDSQLCHGNTDRGKHDWLKTDDYTLFVNGYKNVKYIGPGIW